MGYENLYRQSHGGGGGEDLQRLRIGEWWEELREVPDYLAFAYIKEKLRERERDDYKEPAWQRECDMC